MPKNTTIINKFGNVAGWADTSINLLGRDLEGITEFSYSDSKEKENVYGAGEFPIGRGGGNYEAKASLTLLLEEELALQESLPKGKRLVDIAPFDVTASYFYENKEYSDVVRNTEFTGRSIEVKQGDKVIANKHEMIVTHIDWNV